MKRPIIISLLLIALTLVCLGIGAVIFFAANNGFADNNPLAKRNISSVLEESRTLDVDAEKSLILKVDNASGDVTITGADVDAVQLKAVKTAYDSTQSRADEEVKTIQYTVKQIGSEISIKYELPQSMNLSNRVNTVDLIISVPQNTSVEVRAGAGDVDISNLMGIVNLRSGFGTTTLTNIHGGVSVESQSGAIRASQLQAESEHIVLTTNFGNITLEDVSGRSLNIDSQSGSLKLQDIRLTADLLAATDFGEITLDQVSARAHELDSSSGSIIVDGVRGRLKAYTDFGSINISNATSVTLDVLTNSGNIDFAGSLGAGPHSLHSDFGAITLNLPADSAFNVNLSTNFGQIHSDFPVTITGDIDEQHQVGTLNEGGDELRVETQSGNVSIYMND